VHNLTEDEYLAHYGILRKSGRYPWGSGRTPLQRSRTFLDIVDQHKREGISEKDIAKMYSTDDYPFSTKDLRALRTRSVNLQKQEKVATANRLRDKGMSPSEIGRQMGINESTVRSLLAPGRQEKLDVLKATTDMLKKEVAEKGILDVGSQVQRDLPIGGVLGSSISKDKFDTALSMLKEEGYGVHTFRERQIGTGEFTNYRVLCPPGMTSRQAFANRYNVQIIAQKSNDGGKTWESNAFKPPLNIAPKRVGIRYKEDGGADADGVIYVRPGVKDVELGKSTYAQVRIAVGGTHYLKGMAVYKDDLPKGVDLVFNTNKSNTGNKLDAMKALEVDKEGKVDWTNPFGSFPKPGGQLLGKDGKPTSVMNILREEGDWNVWSRNLSRQLLSKQSPDLAKAQLGITHDRRRQELDDILSLTNQTVKRKLLETFADDTDSSAVHLKAAAMPNQATKVLLPVASMKPTEIFAPTFKNGDRVALVRFPHAGTFEIPELTVNNKNKEANGLFRLGRGGTAPDAVGIHPKVAERLSGADFDGDTVVVIPNHRGAIKSTPALERLKGFDPKEYQVPDEKHGGYKTITDDKKQKEMGKVTNLISDMTVRGADTDHIAQAVRHSMVVIDSEKHNLDYKRSERDHNILALKKRYQGRIDETGRLRLGASTLITRATSPKNVPMRKIPTKKELEGRPDAPFIVRGIDRRTGEKVFVPTGELNRHGKPKTFESKQLAETDDAFTLVSEGRGTPVERVYAEHSNKLKGMANEARKEWANSANMLYSPSAKKTYATEVAQLDAKLNDALKNSPLERRAQLVANQIMTLKRQANPDMDRAEKRKLRSQALDEARLRVGAKKVPVEITPREWEAIQAGAISSNKLSQILNNTDVDRIRELATPPRPHPVMSTALQSKARNMISAGWTYAEVAEALGVKASTIQSSLEVS
jgi:predicted transcriptional regulator